MTIKIVTDSSADMPAQLIEELGIKVVPLYVRFGEEVFRIGMDISDDEFYQRLLHGSVHPTTIQPSPQDFANAYEELAEGADGIVSIHISSILSGTYNSAIQGKELIKAKCPIEVIDTKSTTLALGIICLAAASAAKAGRDMKQVLEEANRAVANTNMLGLLDTLKYLALGGRIGKAKALLGSVLSVKPVLTLKSGEVVPAGQVRTRAKGVEKLVEFAQNAKNIKELAIGYNTTPDEAQTLAECLSPVFDKERMRFATIGPVLGVHAGPGTLIVANLVPSTLSPGAQKS